MKEAKFRLLVLVAVAMFFASSPAWADVTWQFASSTMNGNYTNSKTFSSGAYDITAYGYLNGTPPNTPTALWGKYDTAPHETGLGIASTSAHEITSDQFVQFDVSSLLSQFAGGSFTIGSVQTGESFMLCGSSSVTPGDLGTCTAALFESSPGSNVNTISLMDWGSYNFYSIVGDTGDVVINSLNLTQPVPEPVSMLLLGSGLLGLGFLRRKLGSRA